jgi:hypothetical protein
MKLCLFGDTATPQLQLGKHNLKDPRLDQADQLVEAKKKVYAQIDLIGEDALSDADAFLVTSAQRADLILKDLELIETRLGRTPPEAEKSALLKLQAALETERLASEVELTPDERQALAVHSLVTAKPVVSAVSGELDNPEVLLLRAFREAGFIVFLTVGGKENRAWPIRKGVTAWEAAGSIHSDMQKGFIRAEIIGWDDFVAHQGETGAKRAGKLRLEVKTYVMQDCDVTSFRFNK